MSRVQSEITTFMVRSHRNLRRLVPELTGLAAAADPRARAATAGAAQQAADLVDDNVLAHTGVEDALVDRSLDGPVSRGGAVRLQSQHDTIRMAATRLREHADTPGDGTDATGMIRGMTAVLAGHLDDEWRLLRPALSAIDDTMAAEYEPLLAGLALPPPSARLHLPEPFESVRGLMTRRVGNLRAHISRVATTTVRLRARLLGLDLRHDPQVAVHLDPAVQSAHVDLHVGGLRSTAPETMISPVDLEVVLSPRGQHQTVLELHQVMTPARPLPPDAPAHDMTRAAVRAVTWELAHVVTARRRSHRIPHMFPIFSPPGVTP